VSSGRIAWTAGSGLPWQTYVSYTVLRAAQEAQVVSVAGRNRPVPRPGWLIVVSPSGQPTIATAFGHDGAELGSTPLTGFA
jgi:hypothetical protein